MIKKAILPVAGLGTRFLPATKAQPKEMLAIVDKPVIQYLVEEAVASGITEIIFVTGRGKHIPGRGVKPAEISGIEDDPRGVAFPPLQLHREYRKH